MGVRNEGGCAHTPIIIAGNKIDLNDQRVILKESGEELANQLGCAFLETSAKTPTNVDELFETCGRMIIQHKYPTLPAKKKGGGCSLI
uniref:Hflx-type G domain-containing protein n=1 Tax=Arcella intermedia TaxID=1963864 RepID=A0A6B2LTE7_9EUKA